MNKDVIYIEPEDDITDIITKIEKSKEKIVALVPPKKAGVFRSIVNIKLIAKSGAAAKKTVVLVTVDPSIVKLAAATKLPVTKDLQTAPVIPEVAEGEAESSIKEELVEESDGTVETKEDVEGLNESAEDKAEEAVKEAEEDAEGSSEAKDADGDKPEPDEKKLRLGKNKSGGFGGWVKSHKKLVIFGSLGLVVVIAVLVWALVIAPAVSVTVAIRTNSNNFSENVSFVNSLSEEKASEGKFYLEEKKIESIQEVEFEATGQKNVGEKATGDVIVYYYFPINSEGGEIPVNAGTVFTINGLSYVADKSTSISWDGDLSSLSKDCENYGEASLKNSGCLVSKRMTVTAAESGAKYNISQSSTGWNTTASVGVYSDKAMSGGTDQTITVVQQSDIDKAKATLASSNENENKEKLIAEAGDDALVIASSFNQSTAEAISTPGLGEEVKSGEKAKLKAVTTASIYAIDKTKVEEFITEKADIKDDQKIYEMNNPFIENFTKTEGGYTGKLKTSYLTGPKLTVSSIVDMIKGKGLGDAQHMLKDIEGVVDVKMNPSFPWVAVIPSDTNKITVNLEVKDQNGNKVEQSEDGAKETDDAAAKKDGENK